MRTLRKGEGDLEFGEDKREHEYCGNDEDEACSSLKGIEMWDKGTSCSEILESADERNETVADSEDSEQNSRGVGIAGEKSPLL